MTHPFLSLLSTIALAAGLLTPAVAPAQVRPPAPSLEGRTLDGQPFKLDQLKGKVVLLMFWSTDCAVCRDKMPELRQNVQGWAGKPFELVLVSVDRRQQDLADYDRIVGRMIPVKQRFIQLWAGEAGYRDGFGKPQQLPTSYLIDKTGGIVENYVGRIPAETWDRIADLL